MKAIFYIVAIVATSGAAFFSFTHSNKFKAVEADRVKVNGENTTVLAETAKADAEVAKLQATLKETEDKRDLLDQSVASLRSTGTSLENDSRKLDGELKVQDGEFAQLEKTLEEVNGILAGLGGGVTLDSLPDKIKEIQDDKASREKKLEDLQTLIVGAEKTLSSNRSELDRFARRTVERNSRIGRNATEAVVTAVNQEWGFVVIGAGSNSGFSPQSSLIVERDGRMVGRVTPSSVEPTQTIAEIEKGSLSSGVRLQAGDRVILAKPVAN